MTDQEFGKLIDACLEGELSEADFLRLEAELTVNSAARSEYFDRILLTTLLQTEAETTQTSPGKSRIINGNLPGDRWRRAFVSMAVVCTTLVLMLAWPWLNQNAPVGPETPVITQGFNAPASMMEVAEKQSSGFAILSGQVDAVWAEAKLSPGHIIPAGEMHLLQGLAQLELFSGVSLVVEGTASFSVLSPMEVYVKSGKIRAHVPEPAQGFRLSTTAGEVVDLGTEFAVEISDNHAEVHVLNGEIDWHPHGMPVQRMKQGEAQQITGSNQTAIQANENQFIGSQHFEQLASDQQEFRRQHWIDSSQPFIADKNLISHYRFSAEDVAGRRLPNLSRSANRSSEAAVVAAVADHSRWGKPAEALDFSPAGSRIRLHVPGEFENLSLICWVRINSLDRWYNSLFLTDGHEQGEPHWQIMDDGRLFFSIKKRDLFDRDKGEKDKYVFYSPSFWEPALSGRWIMLATTYDGINRQVTHYLNGQILSQEAIPEEYLVTQIRIGDASLCNWGLPERNQPRFAIRNLNGSLDEFLLFSTALTSAEIHDIYENSRP